MRLRAFTIFVTLVVCVSLFITLLPSNAMPSAAQGQKQPNPLRPEQRLPPDDVPWKPIADGRHYRSADTLPHTSIQLPQATGGPDEYGYTWDDFVPFSWIDAVTGGTDTGLSGYAEDRGPVLVTLPFPFKYYENTYTTAYINAAGFVSFAYYWENWQNSIPSPTQPNDVIAPYWSQDLYLNSTGPSGRVYYKSGGSAPNRYFVVEWYDVRGGGPSDTTGGDDVFRFEIVLYENGTFDFQYQAMTYNGGSRWCYTGAGIEDSTGFDGLEYLNGDQMCSAAPSNKAVRFTRPAPAAQVSINPRSTGAFGSPGGVAQFDQVIRNTGDWGADTYDLVATSSWPITLLDQYGFALTDTDLDGTIDTGPLAQGTAKTVVIQAAVPPTATLGQSNIGQLLVRSSLNAAKRKTMSLQMAVPAAFVQNHTQNYSPYIRIYRPTGQAIRHTTTDDGNDPAVATTPEGNIVQVWSEYCLANCEELYFARLDQYGNLVQGATKITSGSSNPIATIDERPAVAVAPNGNIGIVWYRYAVNLNNSTYNYNIYLLILNSRGTMLALVNLTNSTQWGTWESNLPRLDSPTIAATLDNRWVVAWYQDFYSGSTYHYQVYYAVHDNAGGQVKAPTLLSSDTKSYQPSLTPLADGSVLLSLSTKGQIAYSQISSSGAILAGPTRFTSGGDNQMPDAVQLPNGNIAVVWKHWIINKFYGIGYAILNSALGTVHNPEYLAQTSLVGDNSPSVTYFGNRAILTWTDACCSYRPNLYYALLDDVGNLVTAPMIFASDNVSQTMELPYNGQGNTYLPEANDGVPPTSQAHSPAFATEPFIVTWSGSDAGSGVMNYDVQVRDGNEGMWNTWLVNTANTSALFTTGVAGHTYYFRSMARDWASNVETALPANGDANTVVAAFKVTGHVFNNRHQPVFKASIEAAPSALNVAKSDGVGEYALFLNVGGVYSATASRFDFGALPAQRNLSFSGNIALTDFVLPPASEGITNGGWETGDSGGWIIDLAVTATVEMTAAHTGLYGLRLDTNKAITTTTLPSISQRITVTGTEPTLSWLYRVVQGHGEDVTVMITSDSHVMTQNLTLTPGEWNHAWIDLTGFANQAVTITFGFQDQATPQQLYLDEISVGDTQPGVYPTYLPLIRR